MNCGAIPAQSRLSKGKAGYSLNWCGLLGYWAGTGMCSFDSTCFECIIIDANIPRLLFIIHFIPIIQYENSLVTHYYPAQDIPTIIHVLFQTRPMSDYNRFSSGARFTPFGASANPMQSNYNMFDKADAAFVYNRIHSLKTQMPQDVLELFKANEIAYLKPMPKKKCRKLDPVCWRGSESVLGRFGESEMKVEELGGEEDEKMKKKVRSHNEEIKVSLAKKVVEENTQMWNPFQDEGITSDPYKTLVVARLNYATTEKGLKHEFEKYGAVKSVRIIKDKEGQSNGYGFVEFQKKEDFNYAFKNGDQRRFDGRKIVVDYERGRTMLNWRPKRLGGGEGELRLTPYEKKIKEKQRAVLEEQRKLRNRSRERSREERRKKERSKEREEKERREKEREKEREKDREREREKEKQRALKREREEREDREKEREKDRDRERHKERKDKDRDRSKSKKKQKKEKKDKKDKRDYISTKEVPVQEFIK